MNNTYKSIKKNLRKNALLRVRKGFDDTTEDLRNKMESEFLISKADTVTRIKDNFEAETEALNH